MPNPTRNDSALMLFLASCRVCRRSRIVGCTLDFLGGDRSRGQELAEPVLGRAPSRGVRGLVVEPDAPASEWRAPAGTPALALRAGKPTTRVVGKGIPAARLVSAGSSPAMADGGRLQQRRPSVSDADSPTGHETADDCDLEATASNSASIIRASGWNGWPCTTLVVSTQLLWTATTPYVPSPSSFLLTPMIGPPLMPSTLSRTSSDGRTRPKNCGPSKDADR